MTTVQAEVPRLRLESDRSSSSGFTSRSRDFCHCPALLGTTLSVAESSDLLGQSQEVSFRRQPGPSHGSCLGTFD